MTDNENKKKKVVYTAIIGNYDVLIKPTYINNDYDYICFTDNKSLESDFWKIIYIDDLLLDNTRENRKYKILPHIFLPEYDCSLYIDGNVDIVGDIDDFVKKHKKNHSMLCFTHTSRDCIYEEAATCIELAKDTESVISQQMAEYRAEGYPEHNGLIYGGILYREHHDKSLQRVMEDWWHEVETKSRRDQLSFNYVCWKNRFEYSLCELPGGRDKYFSVSFHNTILTKLYWARSEYSEECSSEKTVSMTDGNFDVRFDLKKCKYIQRARYLRFDPATQPIKLSSVKVALNFKNRPPCVLKIKNTNSTLIQTDENNTDEYTFNHDDPFLEIAVPKLAMRFAETIDISGNVKLLEMEAT